ncbi:MAG: hypothetical protein HYW48_11725 [Deltaproteobacteria bacterium]|nr:hypothetical protein [Deltaproteobacteria bacterium]
MKSKFVAILFLSGTSSLTLGHSFLEEHSQKIADIRNTTVKEHLIPVPVKRPGQCPVLSNAFDEIRKDLSILIAGMENTKCFEKHYELIQNMSGFASSEPEEESKKPKDGALIENSPGIVISITNTQIQNVENKNSLISGLFELSKDPECVEELRAKKLIEPVASTLTRLGSIGMIIPSPIGFIGSAGALALGSSLSILEKFIGRADWNSETYRHEFMLLNCAFYNLRSQLLSSGFFLAKSFNDSQRLSLSKDLLRQLETLSEKLDDDYDRWVQEKRQKLMDFLSGKVGARRSETFALLQQGLGVLGSSAASGETAIARFSITSFFVKHKREFETLLSEYPQSKVLEILSLWADLSTEKLLSLNERTWSLAYVEALVFHIRTLIKDEFSDVEKVAKAFLDRNDFDPERKNQEVISMNEAIYQSLRSSLLGLQTDLSMTIHNLGRIENLGTLDSYDDGHKNYFDIHQSYKKIRSEVLGRKGWHFLKFLINDAEKKNKRFTRQYSTWTEKKKSPLEKAWACHDAFEISQVWDSANSAIEYAYDFLSSNSDLWSSMHPRYLRVLGIPVRMRSEEKLVRAMQSSAIAKSILSGSDKYTERDLNNYPSGLFYNFGKTALAIKKQEGARRQLDSYRLEHCAGEQDWPASRSSSSSSDRN